MRRRLIRRSHYPTRVNLIKMIIIEHMSGLEIPEKLGVYEMQKTKIKIKKNIYL